MNHALEQLKEYGDFSESEIEIAKQFYLQLISTQNTPRITVNSAKISGKFWGESNSNSQELVLPDKMAVGFVCIFGGSLLCILPFGITQGIGVGLIGSGIYSVIDGTREGEKPYYINSQTGKLIEQSGTCIGISREF